MLIFQENSILQKTSWTEKNWTVAELLETADPFSGEPLADRNEAMQKVVEMAARSPLELSETAQCQLDFWIHFECREMERHTAIFRATVDDNYRWEVTINELGLYYRDISGQYQDTPGAVMEQLFSNFWFYGPLRPLPDLQLREKLVGLLRQCFRQADCLSAQRHFALFEYPQHSLEGLQWEEGDHVRRDYVAVRPFGIELSHTTFRDGWSGTGFISFEKFLHLPPAERPYFSPEIRTKIERHLGRTAVGSPLETAETVPMPPTPREKMDEAEALLQNPNSEEGASILISLLEYEAESDYWRNYVFNRFFRLRDNPVVQHFLVECLHGEDDARFAKSRDVLIFWGLHLGEQGLSDREFFKKLNREGSAANDPEYRAALEKVTTIILQKK
ncbi:MAG: hypothetical protein SFV22_14245 [Saprospiraceae bacterium]|nr:hypothetical protein [Saprospiraceae bacterium]